MYVDGRLLALELSICSCRCRPSTAAVCLCSSMLSYYWREDMLRAARRVCCRVAACTIGALVCLCSSLVELWRKQP